MSTTEDLDRRVAERAQLILDAQKIAPNIVIRPEDSDAQIRAKAVVAVEGVEWIDGKCDDYIKGSFRGILARKLRDPVCDVLRDNRH